MFMLWAGEGRDSEWMPFVASLLTYKTTLFSSNGKTFFEQSNIINVANMFCLRKSKQIVVENDQTMIKQLFLKFSMYLRNMVASYHHYI